MRTRTLLALALATAAVVPPPVGAVEPPELDAYRGLGAWVDIYDTRAFSRPGRTVARLASRGVRTLYLETANYHRRGPIFDPRATGKFLEAAHARGMEVVAWYLPGLRNLKRDVRRSMAAIRFTSRNGHRFDGFALDIEASIVKDPARRTRRLLWLSRRIRERVGGSAELGAIIPSPRGMEIKRKYWPGFPYAELADFYDVFLTMTYYSWRAKGPEAVTSYMRRSIDILRERTGSSNVALHAIGGEADESSLGEGRAFVRVVREYGLLGASLYDDSLMDGRDWEALARVQPNPLQSPPMPFAFGTHTSAYGNVPGVEETHPDEVVFRTGPLSGDVIVSGEGFDLDAGEVVLEVNWQPVAALPEGAPSSWTAFTIPVPGSALRQDAANVFSFSPSTRFPSWPTWGIRSAGLVQAP